MRTRFLLLALLLAASVAVAEEEQFVPTTMYSSYNTNNAYQLNDGSLTPIVTDWASLNQEQLLKAKFSEPVILNKIVLYQESVSHYTLKSFKVEGSQDNTNWTVIQTFANYPRPTAAYAPSEISFTNSTPYKYYLIRQAANVGWQGSSGGGATSFRACEVMYYGPPVVIVPDPDPEPEPEPEPETYPADPDLRIVYSKLIAIDSSLKNIETATESASLGKIEYYAATLAATVGLGLGLVMWRIVLLSKNQRRLF